MEILADVKIWNRLTWFTCLHEGFRFSSKDFQSIFWSWFVDFSDYALVFQYLCNSIFSPFVSVVYTWGEVIYAPLIGVYITPTVYVWNLTCLYQKNVVSTCKVLFVNLVLCWPAASRGPNPSCNFTLDHVYYVCEYFFSQNDTHHFHILEMLGEQGGVVSGYKWQQILLSHCDICSHEFKKKR